MHVSALYWVSDASLVKRSNMVMMGRNVAYADVKHCESQVWQYRYCAWAKTGLQRHHCSQTVPRGLSGAYKRSFETTTMRERKLPRRILACLTSGQSPAQNHEAAKWRARNGYLTGPGSSHPAMQAPGEVWCLDLTRHAESLRCGEQTAASLCLSRPVACLVPRHGSPLYLASLV